MDKLKMQTKDLTEENIKKIGNIFPNVITEKEDDDGNIEKGIDFDLLKQELKKELVDGSEERYRLDWPGKRKSLLKANTPIKNKTLRPDKEDSVDFENTENVYIEGENFEVLKLLQESYFQKIKMIYIDPPYNTGKDFVYKDKFTQEKKDYEKEINAVDEEENKLFKENTKTNPRYHSDWLSMIYERLLIARDLLKDDGVIFISIDDNEVHNLRKICDEIFGEGNFLGQAIRRTINSGKHDTQTIATFHEYVLIYTKNFDKIQFNKLKQSNEDREKLYPHKDEFVAERGKYYLTQLNKNSIRYSDSLNYPITGPDGIKIWPGSGFEDKEWCWRWSQSKVNWGLKNQFIIFKKNTSSKYKVYTKSYEKVNNENKPIIRGNPYSTLEFVKKQYGNFNATPEVSKLFEGKKYFDFPKSVVFIKEILRMLSHKHSDIILDFFSGSATTAHAVMQLNAEDGGNRKYVMVQIPEEIDEKKEAYKFLKSINKPTNISEIGKERIRRAAKKIIEDNAKSKEKKDLSNIDFGFRVLKLDSTNMKEVYYNPRELEQNMLESLENNIKEDRTSEDLLTQIILDLGLELSLKIEKKDILKNKVLFVEKSLLIACFDEKIDFETIDEILKLKPLKVVFRDSSFKNDNDKINLQEKFKNLSPNTEIKIL